MQLGSLFLQEMQITGFFLILPLFALGLVLTYRVKFHHGKVYALAFLYVLLLNMTVWARVSYTEHYHYVEFFCMLAGYSAVLSLFTKFIFRVILNRVQLSLPRIVEDLFFGSALIILLFVLVSSAGYNLSILVPTSAVLTGVIGLAMQETLGNFISGVVLQIDRSVQVGDWIQMGTLSGRVSEIHWRYTSIETRNWETVVLPNNVLTQSQVVVQGRRSGKKEQWRRWVYFNVDYNYPPSKVIAVISEMLHKTSAELPQVADDPAPNCVMMDFSSSYARYAVRYWLTDLAADDPTDSEVRRRIYFALQRASIRLSMPAQSLYLNQSKDSATRLEESQQTIRERAAMLAKIELFHPLSNEEREYLASKLLYAPYTEGETITQQGSKAHWLYIIRQGTVKIELELPNQERKEIKRLSDGDFFGEIALLTGDLRSSTVTALSEVEAYRLDKHSFQEVVQNQSSMADFLAEILARRETEIEKLRESLVQDHQHKMQQKKERLLERISHFFKLD